MEETIIIEQFDNGISIKADNSEGSDYRVALDENKTTELGSIIFDSIRNIMSTKLCSIVKLSISYEPIQRKAITTEEKQ